LVIARDNEFATLALPAIGSGSGGFAEPEALSVMVETLQDAQLDLNVTVVRFLRRRRPANL
jgi:O-acetyl-ADP-ribose deacetylase (regulator of RNase III)